MPPLILLTAVFAGLMGSLKDVAAYTPPPHASIDLQYTGKLDYNAPVRVLNLDGFDTSAATVGH